MSGIIDRLQTLYETDIEDLPLLRANASDHVKDRYGSSSATLANALRFLGVATYVLSKNCSSSKSYLIESARIRKSLYRRFEGGEPVSKSYVTMLGYKSLFDALAGCDMRLAEELATILGGRDSIETQYDHPFDIAMGYSLKYCVLGEQTEAKNWSSRLRLHCEEPENRNFRGYPALFNAILNCDRAEANTAMRLIVKGHGRESKGRGTFKDSEDETLCVWGLGLANFAATRCIQISAIPPLIPSDLLFQVRK